jgi:FeS assembly SUF system protein
MQKSVQLDLARLSKTPADAMHNTVPRAESSQTPETPALPAEPLTGQQIEELRQRIVAALCTCFDPEIPVNIYELGLIYEIDIQATGNVTVRMTLTSPACPAAGSLPPEVEHKVKGIPGVASARVEIVWNPPWTKDRMSEAAKLQLGIDD